MARWWSWGRNLTLAAQQNPPQIVEGAMLILATLLCLTWLERQSWQYLVLCLSYIIGAIASMLVREFVAPSIHARRVRVASLLSLSLLLSALGFYLLQTLHPLTRTVL